ncbi:MAG: Phospho-2-dehydro-3-deoxyheptonate aldolase, Tyr-sensitive [Chlamydiota bacterium]|jgi:3-deoxy-7-phosphoheptulonate synthase
MSIPSYRQIKEKIPLSESGRLFVNRTRQHCRDILQGLDQRKVLIVGPCSIHNVEEALAYAHLLKALSKKVETSFLIIMRVYVEKARTSTGWKGLIYDPSLQGHQDLAEGIRVARQLLVQLAEEGIACATEFVDPLIAPYIEDLISWGFIGARTSASPPHRQLASFLEMPVGFKNSLDGNVATAVYAVKSASQAHTFLFPDASGTLKSVSSSGNPWTHIVLRGSYNTPNYTDLKAALALLSQENLPSKIMVDCSHGNAAGNLYQQIEVFEYVNNLPVFGIMLESYLNSGKQALNEPLLYGVSVTDACLDWRTTESLILSAQLSSEIVMRSTYN